MTLIYKKGDDLRQDQLCVQARPGPRRARTTPPSPSVAASHCRERRPHASRAPAQPLHAESPLRPRRAPRPPTQMIALMDRLLKRENLDLRLTVYRVLATASDAGLVEFVPSTTLSAVVAEHRSVLRFLARHNPDPAAPYGVTPAALENFVRSSAGYCVITYILARAPGIPNTAPRCAPACAPLAVMRGVCVAGE